MILTSCWTFSLPYLERMSIKIQVILVVQNESIFQEQPDPCLVWGYRLNTELMVRRFLIKTSTHSDEYFSHRKNFATFQKFLSRLRQAETPPYTPHTTTAYIDKPPISCKFILKGELLLYFQQYFVDSSDFDISEVIIIFSNWQSRDRRGSNSKQDQVYRDWPAGEVRSDVRDLKLWKNLV